MAWMEASCCCVLISTVMNALGLALGSGSFLAMSGLAIRLVSLSISKHLPSSGDVVTHSSTQGQHGPCTHTSLPTSPTT